MSKKHWVDSDHYRVVSDDGKSSWLYKADGGLFFPDSCVEVADHTSQGETYAYEYDGSILGSLFFGSRGKEK